MGRRRGFLLKRRATKLFRSVLRQNCPSAVDPPRGARSKPFSRLVTWTHRLGTKAKAILCNNLDPGRGYVRVGQERILEKPASIPKGHMAVYVGQQDGDCQRILVPVMYFNHPLFGDLLKESEKEYGFNHPGGITIPCRISEFERVQTRIKAVQCARKLPSWKRNSKNSTSVY